MQRYGKILRLNLLIWWILILIQDLAITAPRIWESYIKIMINLNYYFHKFLNLNFYSWSRIVTGRVNNYLEAFQIIIFLVDIFCQLWHYFRPMISYHSQSTHFEVRRKDFAINVFPTQLTFTCPTKNTRKKYEICSKYVINVVLLFLLLTLNILEPFSSVSFVDVEQVNVSWVVIRLIHVFVLIISLPF